MIRRQTADAFRCLSSLRPELNFYFPLFSLFSSDRISLVITETRTGLCEQAFSVAGRRVIWDCIGLPAFVHSAQSPVSVRSQLNTQLSQNAYPPLAISLFQFNGLLDADLSEG